MICRQSGSSRSEHPEMWATEEKSLVQKATETPRVPNTLDCKTSPSPCTEFIILYRLSITAVPWEA